MSGLNETPNANRIHIGIFGRVNSGKSSILNAITGQDVAIVADTEGTTTDPVFKAMEISPIGPVVFIDTAGFDDNTKLGEERLRKTKLNLDKTDVALLVFDAGNFAHITTYSDMTNVLTDENNYEKIWFDELKSRNIPTLILVNKSDQYIKESELLKEAISSSLSSTVSIVSAKNGSGISKIKELISSLIPENLCTEEITGGLVEDGDVVMLVMPQDIQAPKGRLILPQVQTIRELLDKKCICVCSTTEQFKDSLDKLCQPPKLIITDSQAFEYVYDNKPLESMLTSFSVLFAAYKGDITYYLEGAKAIDSLTEDSRVLIAECCTHAPLDEDIGRVKIPRLLKKRVGNGLTVDVVSGTDFPEELSEYDLVIQCGACMFNRRYVLSRIERAKSFSVPMTNYGVTIAHLTGILDKIVIP